LVLLGGESVVWRKITVGGAGGSGGVASCLPRAGVRGDCIRGVLMLVAWSVVLVIVLVLVIVMDTVCAGSESGGGRVTCCVRVSRIGGGLTVCMFLLLLLL